MPPPKLPTKQDGLSFRLDGVTYSVSTRHGVMAIERELFTQTGFTLQRLFEAIEGGATFAVPALVFLARRQAGETVRYAAIEADIEQRAATGDLELELLGQEEEPTDPS